MTADFIWGDNSFNLQVRLKLIKPHLFGMNQETVGMYAQRGIIRLCCESYLKIVFCILQLAPLKDLQA